MWRVRESGKDATKNASTTLLGSFATIQNEANSEPPNIATDMMDMTWIFWRSAWDYRSNTKIHCDGTCRFVCGDEFRDGFLSHHRLGLIPPSLPPKTQQLQCQPHPTSPAALLVPGPSPTESPPQQSSDRCHSEHLYHAQIAGGGEPTM